MFLIGGVVVAWLCQSLAEAFGFDWVGLGLIVLSWVYCDWFLDLGLIWVGLLIGLTGFICWEFGVDCVRIWGRTWRIRWSWFVVDLMVLGLMISKVLNLGFFFLFSFMSQWFGFEFLGCWVCVLVMGLSSWLLGLIWEEYEEQVVKWRTIWRTWRTILIHVNFSF